MKNAIRVNLDQIADCIYNKIQNGSLEDGNGLYSGNFGILLFLFYYSRYSQSPKYISLVDSFSESLMSELGSKIDLHTYCSGLSGILYLFEFLRENEFIDIDIDEVESDLENYLIREMRKDIQNHNYDFMHGSLGVGLYFLKKKTNELIIHELIEFLYSTAEIDRVNKIAKWKSVIDIKTHKIGYNIALSHGISSIVIFLSRVVAGGSKDIRVKELLEYSVNYLLSQEIDFQLYGSHFPIQSKENINKSRLAWCYGDLGIALSLWQAGKAMNKDEWKNKALEIFIDSTKRLSPSENNVFDAGLCHGSAGIVMIYRRMYIETGRSEFLSATNYWVRQTLDIARFEDGLAGYKTYRKDSWICDNSLLEGISGVGLMFTSYLLDDMQEWDDMFLLV